MNPVLKVAACFALAIGPADGLAEQPAVASQPTTLEAAESVHVQPRGPGFAPNSAQDDVVQGQITNFQRNAESSRICVRQEVANLSRLLA
jgi:hypothetical protein